MKPYRRVTRFIHIRVPGDPSPAQLKKVCKQYEAGTLDTDRIFIGVVDIDVDQGFTVGACNSRRDLEAGPDVKSVAGEANHVIRQALPNSDPAVLVTSTRYVVSIKRHTKKGEVVTHTDDREVKERANKSWFDPALWSVRCHWRLKSWNWPKLMIYDYSGYGGRLVWSWVFHIGPLWIIRQRYAL